MPIQKINTGTSANSGNGDSARLWAQKTNANFDYVEAKINAIEVKIGVYSVKKVSGFTDKENWEVGDKFEAWLDNDTRFVKGIVKALPFDLDDSEKVKLVIDSLI